MLKRAEERTERKESKIAKKGVDLIFGHTTSLWGDAELKQGSKACV